MERKIGETFELKGRKLQVKESDFNSCDNCFLRGFCSSFKSITGDCDADDRTDCKDVIFVEVQEQTEQQTEQPQELNLCEILKYCPEGWEFHSSIHGKVRFDHLCPGYDFSVCVMQSDGYIVCYSSDGKYTKNPNSECCLFPSKDQRSSQRVLNQFP